MLAPYRGLFLTNLFVTLCVAFQTNPPRTARSFVPRSQSQFGALLDNPAHTMTDPSGKDPVVPSRQLVIHWRGERDSGYSKPFRQLEFVSALEAELGLSYMHPLSLQFTNALNYMGQAEMTDVNIEHFNEAMQYLAFPSDDLPTAISKEAIIRAVERCSLVHAVYEVIASAEDIQELAPLAIQDGGLEDMYVGESNQKLTWCFRARSYREPTTSDAGREKRYSSRARSMGLEKAGLTALKDLLVKLGGKVDLLEPDCKIYLFDGLLANSKTLARRIASGPRTSIIAPVTRICVTTTPLCPIASFSLCNVARITNESRILDPYAGSCATLLAASMIAPNCQTVGIEIASNHYVNREDVKQDFVTRGLTQPRALLQGDSADPEIRRNAKCAVAGGLTEGFDAIVADPPYGIRESTGFNENSPMEELFGAIIKDREAGQRLLKPGARLVAFVPVTDEETLEDMLPNKDLTDQSGLVFEVSREQPLNDKLSRWLVSFVCVR